MIGRDPPQDKDLRRFRGGQRAHQIPSVHTRTILERLIDAERHGVEADAPWGDLHGKPLNERALASMPKRYDVHSIKVKVGGEYLQGYRREHLHDAWARYLPTVSPKEAEPLEPVEPSGLAVAEVPQVPAAMGSVRCKDCAYFDGEDDATTRYG